MYSPDAPSPPASSSGAWFGLGSQRDAPAAAAAQRMHRVKSVDSGRMIQVLPSPRSQRRVSQYRPSLLAADDAAASAANFCDDATFRRILEFL